MSCYAKFALRHHFHVQKWCFLNLNFHRCCGDIDGFVYLENMEGLFNIFLYKSVLYVKFKRSAILILNANA